MVDTVCWVFGKSYPNVYKRCKLHFMRKRLEKDKSARHYADLAITPVVDAENEALEMFELNAASRAAVEKARRQAQDRLRPAPAAMPQRQVAG